MPVGHSPRAAHPEPHAYITVLPAMVAFPWSFMGTVSQEESRTDFQRGILPAVGPQRERAPPRVGHPLDELSRRSKRFDTHSKEPNTLMGLSEALPGLGSSGSFLRSTVGICC